MRETQQRWLDKAKESIRAAEVLLNEECPEVSVSRAYYAMFYLAQAILLTEDLVFSKHSAVISAFGQHFVKTGRITVQFHQYLREAKEERLLGDYDMMASFTREEAMVQIDRAKSFFEMTNEFLNRKS